MVSKQTETQNNKGCNYTSLASFMDNLEAKNPDQNQFHEVVHEVLGSVWDVLQGNPEYIGTNILERITEPERVISFRVPWTDDGGNVQVNRGYRVEFNSAIGPYKGGLRFHPSVNLDILKFLAFEQTFKNSLTTMPMGGGKGGADFDPKGRSDNEIMHFCQSFMTELFRHIGHNTDVPAGDIGVGTREIGYLFGQYKRLQNEYTGILTGKGLKWGGSRLREEATGYGTVYFVREMYEYRDETIEGKRVAISGSGNVAQFAAEKAIQLGAKVVSLSDSDGAVHDPDGIDEDKLKYVKHLKNVERGRIWEYAEKYGVEYDKDGKPWAIPCDIALPCATQNEIEADDAKELVKNGCECVAEGANKPAQREAVSVFLENEILFGPGKAANAGGVAVSGLEMTQNEMRMQWPRSEVDDRLQEIMEEIHETCITHAKTDNEYINYVEGANIAGFTNVADAMLQQGIV